MTNSNATATTSIAPESLTIHDSVTASVHFDGSSADYHNAVGMYVYDNAGTVTSTQILYGDASYRGLAGGAADLKLSLKEGQHIGFFVAPNAAVQGDVVHLMQAGGTFHLVMAANGAAANVNAGQPMQLAYQAANGDWSNVHTQFWTSIFTTNTRDNVDGLQHAKMTTDAATGQVHVTFEDMMGGGNLDFKDASFTLTIGRENVRALQHSPMTVSEHLQSENAIVTGWHDSEMPSAMQVCTLHAANGGGTALDVASLGGYGGSANHLDLAVASGFRHDS